MENKELTEAELLRMCIDSGQVSQEQIEQHRVAGGLAVTPLYINNIYEFKRKIKNETI